MNDISNDVVICNGIGVESGVGLQRGTLDSHRDWDRGNLNHTLAISTMSTKIYNRSFFFFFTLYMIDRTRFILIRSCHNM